MNLKARVCLSAFVLLFIPSVYVSAQECLSYEADGVHLTGTISKKTFPGPPNYESIARGDEPEIYWVLHLSKPICAIANGDSDAESNVTDLQLILTGKQYKLYRKFIRRKPPVTVTGKLTHAITGHHHTPVLMEVTGIR